MAKSKTSHMAPKVAKTPGGKSMVQKLSSGSLPVGGKSGTDAPTVQSRLEPAALIKYQGHTLGKDVRNGAHGLLGAAGKGLKGLKPPTK